MRISNMSDRRFCMINSTDIIVLSLVRKVNIDDFSILHLGPVAPTTKVTRLFPGRLSNNSERSIDYMPIMKTTMFRMNI